jgi:hypothetical protein
MSTLPNPTKQISAQQGCHTHDGEQEVQCFDWQVGPPIMRPRWKIGPSLYTTHPKNREGTENIPEQEPRSGS